jgi:membrane protease YdiL (CAAX protease family)
LVAGLELLLCSDVPTQIVIGNLLRMAGMTAMTDTGPTLVFVVSLSMIDTVVLIALMTTLTHARGQSPAALWLGTRSPLREAGLGLLLVPVIFLLVAFLMNALVRLLPALHNVPANPIEGLATGGPYDAIALGVVAIFAGGIREELQRAFLLQRFEQYFGGATVGLIVLSVAFGLGHYYQGWDAVMTTGVLGAIWAAVYLRRRSSVAPIVSHAGFNSLEVLRVALVGS